MHLLHTAVIGAAGQVCDTNCNIPLSLCCMDLPHVSSYDEIAAHAIENNMAAFLKMVLHSHWEDSLPPGMSAPDETLPISVDLDQYEAFVPPAELWFLAKLQENWQIVLQEYQHAIEEAPEHNMEWSDGDLCHKEKGWNVFGLIAYGEQLQYNQSLCPVTTRLLKDVPNLNLAGFSTLAPEAHLLPQ